MRGALVVLGLLAIGLAFVCYLRGGTALLLDGLRAGLRGVGPLLPMLVLMFALAGFAEVLLPRQLVATWLSESSGIKGLSIAVLLGIVTRVGTDWAAHRRLAAAGRGGRGVIVTYLSSMALLSFVRVPLELGIYGLRLTLLRIVCCLPLPFRRWLRRAAPQSPGQSAAGPPQ